MLRRQVVRARRQAHGDPELGLERDPAAPSGVNEPSTSGQGQLPAMARSSMVATSSWTRRPLGIAADVPADQTQIAERAGWCGRNGHVEPQHVGLRWVRCSCRRIPARCRWDTGQQDGQEVGPRCVRGVERASWGTPRREEARQQSPPAAGWRRTGRTGCRPTVDWAFHVSFRESGIRTSLNNGLPSRDTWTKGPEFEMAPDSPCS